MVDSQPRPHLRIGIKLDTHVRTRTREEAGVQKQWRPSVNKRAEGEAESKLQLAGEAGVILRLGRSSAGSAVWLIQEWGSSV